MVAEEKFIFKSVFNKYLLIRKAKIKFLFFVKNMDCINSGKSSSVII
jgi:hypothetical protein